MAYRNNKGATGGPGGVLCLQKKLLGTEYQDIPLVYKFKNTRRFFSRLKGLYLGAFIQVFTRESFKLGNYYICNDIGTAFALACLHKKYSLIYHNQGPILEENHNFKTILTPRQKKRLLTVEKYAFKNAKSVHFPSKGAEDMFFNSPFRSIDKKNVNCGMVLPNTILECESCFEYPIVEGIKPEPQKLTLLSVGTLTEAKGQDQVLDFLDIFLEIYQESVRYIVVGQGPLKENIVKKGQQLEEQYSNFQFIYIPRLNHTDILKLNFISDVYIMLHRLSIFDLATLEAMSQSSEIVLSDVGGNIDFNVENNVILVSPVNYMAAAIKLANSNVKELKALNYKVFSNYFSPNNFKLYYEKLLNNITNQ